MPLHSLALQCVDDVGHASCMNGSHLALSDVDLGTTLALGSVRLSHAKRFGGWAKPRRRSVSAGPALYATRQLHAMPDTERRRQVMRHELRRFLREESGEDLIEY